MSESVRKNILGVCLLAVFISLKIAPSFGADDRPSIETLVKNYQFLSIKERTQVHLNLMKVLAYRAKHTKYQDKVIKENFTVNYQIILLNMFIKNAYADVENPEIFCNFGGWMSTFDRNGECQAPWRRTVRDDSRLETFGPTYTRRFSCGGANLFRCNPNVFGPGEDGRGLCVTANDSDPQSSTQACLDVFYSETNLRAFIENLAEDPEKFSKYLGLVAETLRFCRDAEGELPYCSDLTSDMLNVSTLSMRCVDRDELKSYLPDIITPFNIDELNSITDGLGTEAKEYRKGLEKRQEQVRRQNREIYLQGIEAYQNSQVTKDTMERILENTDECFLKACRGSKDKYTSVAYCARYVKFAFFPPGDDGRESFSEWSNYPWSEDAVESGPWLEDAGFVNLMDIPEMSHLTPETAPIGSFIVYSKPGSGKRYNVDGEVLEGPGHIEMRTAEDEYVSDFINDEPTTVGGARRPIGIYVKIPPEIKARLQEVPQR